MGGIGDLQAWMDRFGPAVLRLARSYLRDAHEAEDVYQEVFLRALVHASGRASPRPRVCGCCGSRIGPVVFLSPRDVVAVNPPQMNWQPA